MAFLPVQTTFQVMVLPERLSSLISQFGSFFPSGGRSQSLVGRQTFMVWGGMAKGMPGISISTVCSQ